MSAQLVTLQSGRTVLDTGKVQIGLRHGEPATPRRVARTSSTAMSADAEWLQATLLTPPTPGPLARCLAAIARLRSVRA